MIYVFTNYNMGMMEIFISTYIDWVNCNTWFMYLVIGKFSYMDIVRCNLLWGKDVMQGKLFQKCTHLLYCSVLSLGGNVNTRRMSKPDMGSIFHINNQWNILVIGNYYVNYQNSMLLTSSNTKLTLRHLFLFTNSAQKELVSICTQSTRLTAINIPCITFLMTSKYYSVCCKYELITL